MKTERRTVKDIRASLWETRNRLDHDLEELDVRLHQSLSPRAIFARHPALFGIAGAAVGFLLVRHPALLGQGLLRAAQLSAPLLVKALLPKKT
jgi:hypothetical protein